MELKEKTEDMLTKIFKNMREGRLLINAGKTKLMLFATVQKRTKNNLKFHVDIEGEKVEEVQHATLLGVTLSNNISWDIHVNEVLEKCSQRLGGLYRVQRELNRKERKNLAEGAIVSRIKYALEVTSSGSEGNIKRLEAMQSKCARYVLGKSRKDWSRTEGYEELNWITIPQSAVEASLRLFFRVLKTQKPDKLYHSIFDVEKRKLKNLSSGELERMTKLSRKSWTMRVIRYSEIVPQILFELDPKSREFKVSLKSWIKRSIHKDGDSIFKGNVNKPTENVETDGLLLELKDWKCNEEHEMESIKEAYEIEEPED